MYRVSSRFVLIDMRLLKDIKDTLAPEQSHYRIEFEGGYEGVTVPYVVSDADEVVDFIHTLEPRPQALRGSGYYHTVSPKPRRERPDGFSSCITRRPAPREDTGGHANIHHGVGRGARRGSWSWRKVLLQIP